MPQLQELSEVQSVPPILEHPVGCYDERRFPSREAMIEQIMSVYSDE